jgi:hypothetical protein
MCRMILFFSTCFEDVSIGSTDPEVSVFANNTHQEPGISGSAEALRTQESRFPQILLISHIAEMRGEFETTLVIEPGADGASTIRVAE